MSCVDVLRAYAQEGGTVHPGRHLASGSSTKLLLVALWLGGQVPSSAVKLKCTEGGADHCPGLGQSRPGAGTKHCDQRGQGLTPRRHPVLSSQTSGGLRARAGEAIHCQWVTGSRSDPPQHLRPMEPEADASAQQEQVNSLRAQRGQAHSVCTRTRLPSKQVCSQSQNPALAILLVPQESVWGRSWS